MMAKHNTYSHSIYSQKSDFLSIVLKDIACAFIFFLTWFLNTPVCFSDQKTSDAHWLLLSLDQAIELALNSNRALAGSIYIRENAALSLEAARSEFDFKWAPSANAGISREDETTRQLGTGVLITKRFEVGVQASVGPGLDVSEDDYTGRMAVSFSVPLLKGFGKAVTLDSVYSAEQGLRESQRNLHLFRVATVIDTAATVYGILQQQELVRLYGSQVRSLESQAQLASVKEKAGLATPLDIYRAEIRIKDAQERLSRAREEM